MLLYSSAPAMLLVVIQRMRRSISPTLFSSSDPTGYTYTVAVSDGQLQRGQTGATHTFT